MTTSKHDCGPLARALLAVGGIGALIAVAALARYAAAAYGPLAGILAACAPFATCWLVFRVRPALRLARPARNCDPAAPAEVRPPARIAA